MSDVQLNDTSDLVVSSSTSSFRDLAEHDGLLVDKSSDFLGVVQNSESPADMACTQIRDNYDVSDDDPPSVRAARNPNHQVLLSVLSEGNKLIKAAGAHASPAEISSINYNYSADTHVSGALYSIYSSPLVAAISACLPRNVAVLLEAGADPNGIPLSDLDDYSARLIRGSHPNCNPYSVVSRPSRARVMAATGNVPQMAPLTTLEIAARRKVFSRFWSDPEFVTLRSRLLPARTALETAAGVEAYDILSQNAKADLSVRTPIFSIHVLHLAAARLDVLLLQHLTIHPNTPLEAAGTTALGHTLLHISTLPSTDAQINIFSPKIFYSIHDVRTLDTKHWLPINLRLRNPARRRSLTAITPLPLPRTTEDEEDSRRQEETVLWLLRTCTQDVGARDVFGNTALHYLASAMWVNNELLRKVRAWEGAETVWTESRNELGYTPEELLEDGKRAEREQWKAFWMDAKII